MKQDKKDLMKLNIIESECDCQRCSDMCHAPCCPTIEDANKLIDKGYANRLMLDDYPYDSTLLKPALKGYEGMRAPWETASIAGCTFWKDGKCELHALGLKPLQAKLVLHGQTDEQTQEIADHIRMNWSNEVEANKVIERWRTEKDETKSKKKLR